MGGIELLRQARDKLECSIECDPRNRLRQAARRFWQAVYEFESWPPAVQDHATTVLRRLFRDGVIDDTVAKASNDTVELLAHEIHTFCNVAETHSDLQIHTPHDELHSHLLHSPTPRRTFGDFL